jgi:hypothetical protein
MKIRVIAATQPNEWNGFLQRLVHSDVYFSAEYHLAHELNGDGTALSFVVEDGEKTLFHPFLIRLIPEFGLNDEQHDIESVYGYSGPLSNNGDRKFLTEAWAAFSDWCRQQNVVAEFIRFHPLLDNKNSLEGFAKVSPDRETVLINLDGTPDSLWASYPSAQRSKIRRAQNEGLVCRNQALREGLPEFRCLYKQTMQNVGAAAYYFFGDAYFENLACSLNEHGRIFSVYKADRVIASALFLYHAPFLHYHLGGSDPAHRDARPNNLLFHTAALWGQDHGCRWLHLGGGRTSAPDDELLRFKSSFSQERRVFYTGRRVHCQKTYDWLCAEWMKQNNVTERPPYFLLYRLPIQSVI